MRLAGVEPAAYGFVVLKKLRNALDDMIKIYCNPCYNGNQYTESAYHQVPRGKMHLMI